MNIVLDSTGRTFGFALDLVWKRMCISVSETVWARVDRTTSLSTCSMRLNKSDLRPLFKFKQLACNETLNLDSTASKIWDYKLLVHLVRQFYTIASTSVYVTILRSASACSTSFLVSDGALMRDLDGGWGL